MFGGLGIGALWKSFTGIFNLFLAEVGYSMPRTVAPERDAERRHLARLWASGHAIAGARAGTMRRALSWLVLLPLFPLLGAAIPTPFLPIHPAFANNPATGPAVPAFGDGPWSWSAYIRYIGAGAVLAAGSITSARTLPTIVARRAKA